MSGFVIETNLEKTMARIGAVSKFNLLTIGRLEQTLRDAFDFSQLMVPVDTGSLRGSGDSETNFDDDVWTGEVAYGGPSPGAVHDPVLYSNHVVDYYSPNDWMNLMVQSFGPKFTEVLNDHWDAL